VPVWWWLAAIAACVAASFVLGGRFHEDAAPLPAWMLTRLTSDSGLSNAPAMSSDGKLVAYSSTAALRVNGIFMSNRSPGAGRSA
jgi:hypothetical protein